MDNITAARLALAVVVVAISLPLAAAHAEDTIKLGFIDPLSGPGASLGEPSLRNFQYFTEEINAAGAVLGRKMEVINFDNKMSPQEALIQAQKVVDRGIHYLTQGSSGSAVGAALSDFATKYGDRTPHRVLYLNYAAVDPLLTNEKCSFWHFRWDANTDMKTQALTTFMKDRPSIKKVYLINPDYSIGQSVRTQVRAMLRAKRPDVEIVGDELHPLFKVTDFAPYVVKIKASGADTIITIDFGQDIALLFKAAADAGLQTDWYTYYGNTGSHLAIKQSKLEHRVFVIAASAPNSAPPEAARIETEFRTKLNQPYAIPSVSNEVRMLAKAIELANSDDAQAVATKLEGMTITTPMGGEGFMRKEDHQFLQDMYILSFGPLDPGAKFEEEGTGWGWKQAAVIKAKDTVLPTPCNMSRP